MADTELPELPQNVSLKLMPPAEAVAFFQSKGLKRTTDWRDLWQDEHSRMFTVSKLTRLDLLQSVYDGVNDAITEGISLKQFQDRLTPVLQKGGWWGTKERTNKATGEVNIIKMGSPQRLALIYDVNLRTAYSAGRWKRTQDNKDILPILVYRTMHDSRVRPLHRQWDGVALPVDHPFWDTHYPPNGWRCRCLVYQVDNDGLYAMKQTMQITETAPNVEYMTWDNQKTGEKIKVPYGIDPGWAYNPGKAALRNKAFHQTLTNKLATVANPLALEAVDDIVQSDAFTAFYDKPSGNFPIAVLDSELQNLLQASSPVVLLSDETLTIHKVKHSDIGIDDYQLLPDIIRHGTVMTKGENKLVFYRSGKTLYKAVIKATKDKKELYILTLHHAGNREIERDLRLGGKIIRE